MMDYRSHLTALVAVFLALGLGMLIGITLIGSPPPEGQMHQLLQLQQDFQDFRRQYEGLTVRAADLETRLQRADNAWREVLPAYTGRRLIGRRIAVILIGELQNTGFLSELRDTLESAGGQVVSTTRISDDWLPVNAKDRDRILLALGLPNVAVPDSRAAAAVGRSIGNGRSVALLAASRLASGLRLEGNYSMPPHSVLLISGTRTEDRLSLARAGLTPETGVLVGLRETPARVVVAETDSPEAFTTIPLWTRDAAATVDNVDMASGQFSALWALAGRDGRYGLKNAAERPIPRLGLK